MCLVGTERNYEPKKTVNTNLYSQQLTLLSEAWQKKRPFSCIGKQKVILLHDNARPHVAKSTRERIENLRSEVLPDPAYYPYLKHLLCAPGA